MAVISMFYGIIISMYFFDNRQHNLPHIHVKYQEHNAVLSIPEGDIIAGNMPKKKLRLVQAWVYIHQDELIADWELASTGREIFKIEALR